MLEIKELYVKYGDAEVLHGINLHIESGEIVTLIGGNGAGKTTTLRAVSGLVRPSKGKIFSEGVEISNLPPEQIIKRGIAHVPEGRRIFPRLSVEDNLKVGAYLVRNNNTIAGTLQKVYEIFPKLAERKRQYGETLSGGEQQMLALGRAIMAQPKVILLDEPSLGLAPLVVKDVAHTISALRDSGITILLVEQNTHVALSISDRAYVLEVGSIALEGGAEQLMRSPKIVDSYLGGMTGK